MSFEAISNEIRLELLGDRAFLARFADMESARGWAVAVRNARFAEVEDVVLGFRDVAIFPHDRVVHLEELAQRLRAIAPVFLSRAEGVTHKIPMLYDGEDLADVSRRLGISEDSVIRGHQAPTYTVRAIGFLPGFPYAGELPGPLSGLPRRDQPRPRVPAGAVAIVGQQTGIYPRVSPGGWWLLGRTPLRIADPETGHFPIRAGDSLRFVAISPQEFRDRLGLLLVREV